MCKILHKPVSSLEFRSINNTIYAIFILILINFNSYGYTKPPLLIMGIHHLHVLISELESKIILYHSDKSAKLTKKHQLMMQIKGTNPKIERIHLKTISPRIEILLVFFQQGYVRGHNFNSSTVCYFITYDTITKKYFSFIGPTYSNKKYFVEDLDGDGVKEVIFSHPTSANKNIFKLINNRYWEVLQ